MRIIRPLTILLAISVAPTFVAADPPTEGEGPGLRGAAVSDAVASEAARIGALPQTDQLRWTQDALRRFHRANLAIFQSAEVYRRYDWAKKMADEIVRGGPQKKLALTYLVQELAKAEKAAFEELRHEFKRTVVTSLDSDPGEQKRRLEAWDQLFDQWQVAGGTDNDRAKLITWLRKAIQNQRLGAGPLPPFPELGEKAERSEDLLGGFDLMHMGAAPRSKQDVDWPKWKIEQMVSITRKPMGTPLPALAANPVLVQVSRASSVPHDAAARFAGDTSMPPSTPKPLAALAHASTDRHADASFPTTPTFARSPGLWGLTQAPLPRATAPAQTVGSSQPSPRVPDVAPGRVMVAKDTPSAVPARPHPSTPGLETNKPQVAEFTPKDVPPRIATASPPASRVPRTNHSPAAPPVGVVIPLPADTRRPEDVPAPTSIASRIENPPSPFASVDRTPAKKTPSVNLQRLNTLVRGYNLAVRELETKLDAPRDWNARNLTPVVAQLRDLTQRERDLRIFEQLVSEGDREYMEPVVPLNPVVSQIAAAIYEARNRAMRRDYTGSSRIRTREIEDLHDLSRQLAKLAVRP